MMNSPPTQVPPTSVLYKLDKVAYSTPPPVSSDPANNECKLIEYRGAKVASFTIAGDVMICLPQAFDLFLRHLVGGLHTVYTKLKRLNIIPVVCNVEQVRILRGLGAIQPGVNRCKLLTRKEFDVLYEDCTTASSRPGRPPKRSLPLSLSQTVHMLHGLQQGDPLKKPKMENGLAGLKAPLPFNGYDSLMAGASPYLLTTHPALVSSTAFPGHHISSPSIYTNGGFIASAASIQNSLGSPNSKSSSGSGEHPGTDNESISPRTDHSSGGGGPGSRELASPPGDSEFNGEDKEVDRKHQRAMAAMEQSLAAHARDDLPTASPPSHTSNHSKTSHMNGLLAVDVSSSRSSSSHSNDSPDRERSVLPSAHSTPHPHPHPHSHPHHHNPHSLGSAMGLSHLDRSASATKEMFAPQGPSSIETLLTNIQGLLKVAADNARQQEKHIHLERAELRLELLRERELRESLEKQLMGEQKRLAIILKRLKKEKKARRRLQEQMEHSHSKRHGMTSETEAAVIARQNSTESLRALNESLSHELEKERMARSESDKKSAASDSSPMSYSPPPPAQPPFQQDQAYAHLYYKHAAMFST